MTRYTYVAGPETQLAAKEALQVQDACNLLAVLNSFHRRLNKIFDEQPLDTMGTRQHPVVVLFVDKLAHLANVQSSSSWTEITHAQEAANRLKDGEDVTMEDGKLVENRNISAAEETHGS